MLASFVSFESHVSEIITVQPGEDSSSNHGNGSASSDDVSTVTQIGVTLTNFGLDVIDISFLAANLGIG